MGLGAGGSGSTGGQANDGGAGSGGMNEASGGERGGVNNTGGEGSGGDYTAKSTSSSNSSSSSQNSYDPGAAAAAAAIKAAEIQAAAYREGLALQKEIYEQTREDTRPWRETGEWALGEIKTGINKGTFDPGEFEFNFTNDDPSYQFRLSENQKALERSAASRGMTQSGAQSKALSRYTQDYASTEYGNAFSRALQTWDTKRLRGNDKYNQFAGLSNTGQQTTVSLGTVGTNYANSGSNLIAGAGNATAAGLTGAEEARTSAYRWDQEQQNYQDQLDSEDRASKNNLFGTAIGVGIGILGI